MKGKRQAKGTNTGKHEHKMPGGMPMNDEDMHTGGKMPKKPEKGKKGKRGY